MQSQCVPIDRSTPDDDETEPHGMVTQPGRSWRTPAKHAVMNELIGSEVGATHAFIRASRASVGRLVWYDLTAGDGIASDEADSWETGCSPGILAHHAKKSGIPVSVLLHEIADANYDRLLISLHEQLPRLGYDFRGDGAWHYRETVTLTTHNVSGHLARTDILHPNDAVFAFNDPNAMTTWAMSDTFAEDVAKRTWMFRSLHTMGCNASGLKRLGPEDRLSWFDLVDQQQAALPQHRDLLLAAIDNDKAQWAYLVATAEKWREKTEALVGKAFANHGRTVAMSWYRKDPDAFQNIKLRLFLTHPELQQIRGTETAWLTLPRTERLARIIDPNPKRRPAAAYENTALFHLDDLFSLVDNSEEDAA
jgi:hypothetical protein